jgi:hypothetical protein
LIIKCFAKITEIKMREEEKKDYADRKKRIELNKYIV